MEHLVTVANLLYVCAYFVRDTLWLRVFSFGGTLCLVLYFYTLPEPLMHVVYWNVLFVVINAGWIARLALARCVASDSATIPPAHVDRSPGFTSPRSARARRSSWLRTVTRSQRRAVTPTNPSEASTPSSGGLTTRPARSTVRPRASSWSESAP